QQIIIEQIEQIFACKISDASLADASWEFTDLDDSADLSIVKSFIKDQNMLTQQYVKDLISKYLNPLPELKVEATFADYIDTLVNTLAAVKYRYKAGYELNDIMPSQRQLFALQQACFKLTGNFSAIYLGFIQ